MHRAALHAHCTVGAARGCVLTTDLSYITLAISKLAEHAAAAGDSRVALQISITQAARPLALLRQEANQKLWQFDNIVQGLQKALALHKTNDPALLGAVLAAATAAAGPQPNLPATGG